MTVVIPQSFHVTYQRLAEASKRYTSVKRSPANLDVLADAHWALHLARRDMALERARLEAAGAIYTLDDRVWLDGLGIDA